MSANFINSLKNFEQLGVQASLLQSIGEMGFENPTPIQEQSIPVFLETGRDILGLAQTGTGKTAAFGLPILQLIDINNKSTQALIICPTRELCMQISRDLNTYRKYLSNINIVPVYGGSSISGQIGELKRGAQIIVATPGRLMDLMDRKAVNIKTINFVVLDEADEMLNMGFEEDVERILAETPKEKRVCLFSATMPKQIRNIANRYMNDPVELTAGKKNSANENITHEYAVVQAKDKYAALKRALDFTSDYFYGIIFCTTKNETQDISDKLIKDGYNSDCLHGDLSQPQREKVMNRFRHKTIKILLATDVAARGIDVTGLTHVIHYHLPDDIENYTHRSGRTARAGKKGISFTLLNIREAYRLKEIERLSNIRFQRIQIPSAQEVLDKKLIAFTQTILNSEVEESVFNGKMMENLLPLNELSKEDLLKKVLSLELKRFSADYLNAPDLNAGERSSRAVDDAQPGGGSRLFVSVGKKDGFDIRSFKDWVAQVSNISWQKIRVDVSGVYSFIDAQPEDVDAILKALNEQTYNGRQVRAEVSGDKPRYSSGGGGSRSGGGDRRRGGGDDRGRERRSFSGGDDRNRRGGNSFSGGAGSGRRREKRQW